jgi:hypothetical protein
MSSTATPTAPGTSGPASLVHAGVVPVPGDRTAAELEGLLDVLAGIDGTAMTGTDRIDVIGMLERIKAACAAAQARVSERFEDGQLQSQDARGVHPKERGRGIGDQVALARGCAASQGDRHLGFAKAVVREMPHTHHLLTRGEISEWVATLLVRETAILSVEDRRLVDERLCATTVHTETGEVSGPRAVGATPRRVEHLARALATELDPEAAVKRAAKAARHRRVTIRPAPDTMSYVTGLLPVAQGVACWAGLTAAAKAIKAAGDDRTIGQITADLFVERLTGQPTAEAVSVEVGVMIGADALAGASERPGRMADGTPVPAGVVRNLAERPDAPAWLRRILTDPVTGAVVHVDAARHRFHSAADTRHAKTRDQVCRHPRCDRPIAHVDHPHPVARGGPSTRANSQGLCEGHNYVKELPGWETRVVDPRPGQHTIEVTTPTGHTYRS